MIYTCCFAYHQSGTGTAWRGEQGPGEGSIPARAVRESVRSVALGVDSDAARRDRSAAGRGLL